MTTPNPQARGCLALITLAGIILALAATAGIAVRVFQWAAGN